MSWRPSRVRARPAALLAAWLPAQACLVATVGVRPGQLRVGHDPVDLDLIDSAAPMVDPPRSVAVVAQTLTDLRRCLSIAALLPAAADVLVAVLDCVSRPALPPAGPALPDVVDLRLLHGPGTEWGIRVSLAKPAPAGAVVDAVVRALGRHAPLPVHRVGLAGPGAAYWRPGDHAAAVCPEDGGPAVPEKQPATDVVLRMVGRQAAPFADSRVSVVDRPALARLTWTSLGRSDVDPAVMDLLGTGDPDQVPPIDEYAVNPVGFVSAGTTGLATMRQAGDVWAIHGVGGIPLIVHPSGTVTDADVARLRPMRGVVVEFGRHSGPVAAIRTVAGLACAGVPLVARDVPRWAAALGSDLIGLITGVTEKDLDDDLSREVHSIRLRRAAMRTHSTRARWRRIQSRLRLPLQRPPTVSVLLCTMRPEFVDRAVTQIAEQRGVDLELVVIRHGADRAWRAAGAALTAFDRPLTVLDADATEPFGAALNRGVAAAAGDLVAKWDDDDWYGPEHVADLLLAHEYTGAELVGGGHELTYLEEIDLTIHRPAERTEQFLRHVAGGSMLIERSVLREVGGFRPLPRAIDTNLQRSVLAAGGRTYRTHGLGYVMHRRPAGHSWDVPITHFIRENGTQWRGRHLGPLIDSDRAEAATSRRAKADTAA